MCTGLKQAGPFISKLSVEVLKLVTGRSKLPVNFILKIAFIFVVSLRQAQSFLPENQHFRSIDEGARDLVSLDHHSPNYNQWGTLKGGGAAMVSAIFAVARLATNIKALRQA